MSESDKQASDALIVEQRKVTQRYTEMASLYADLFVGEIDNQPDTLEILAALAAHASSLGSTVLDLGCGPGHVTEHLHSLGADAIGVERSAGMLEQARSRFPHRNFCRGDLSCVGVATASAAGIVSRFSTIHLQPTQLPAVFDEYARILMPDGRLVLGFFAADEPDQHGDDFDHKVATAYRVDVDVMTRLLNAAGFIETQRNFTLAENRRSHATLVATRI